MLSTLLLVGSQFGQTDSMVVEPEAAVVIDAVKTACANLQTIRFTMSPPMSTEEKLKVAYRRNGGLLVQALDPSGKRIVSEYRELGRKIIVSSPNNHRAYLRDWIRQGPHTVYFFGFGSSYRSPLSWNTAAGRGQGVIKNLIETFPTTPMEAPLRGQATIRMGTRGVSTDGVPIDRILLEENYDHAPHMEAPRFKTDRTVYCVGVKDRLLRRIERSVQEFPRRTGDASFGPAEITEFLGVVANQPIPDKTFEFRPLKGMTAIDDRPWDPTMGTKVSTLTGEVKKAMADLRSLSFVSDLISTRRIDRGPSVTRRTVARFDLERPLLAYGEVSIGDGPERIAVVCDGQELRTRGGKSYRNTHTASSGSLPWRIRTFDDHSLDGGKGTEIGCGADMTLSQFLFEGGSFDYFMGFELEAPRKVGTETLDVLSRTTRDLDDDGIPTGDVWVDRYLIGRNDRLIHGYEGTSPSSLKRKRTNGRVVLCRSQTNV